LRARAHRSKLKPSRVPRLDDVNLALIGRLLAGFTLFFAAAMAIPLGLACFEDTPFHTVRGFAAGVGLGAFVAAVLWVGGRGAGRDLFRKEGLVVVGLAWLVASALGAVPLEWSGALPRGADAFFESVSGLTTTGATVLGTGGNSAPESLPQSLLLWRAMLHWMGGLGVILVFIVLLPAVGVTGSKLLSSEQTGVSSESLQPRLQAQARTLFRLYLLLTAAAALAYWLAAMEPFDAICHAFATLSTGGFSTKNASIGQYQSLPLEVAAIVFMFLGGSNFLFLVRIALGRAPIRSSPLQATEFRFYALVMVLVIGVLTLVLWLRGGTLEDPVLGIVRDYDNLATCLREAAFNGVSVLTSTGFQTADYQLWPNAALAVLLLSMLVGASTGSTAGGIKMLRLLACSRLIAQAVRAFIQPKVVMRLKLGGEVVPDPVKAGILALVLLWVATVAFATFVLLLLEPRLDCLSAFSASMTLLANCGPAISAVVPADGTFAIANAGAINLGPYGGYGDLAASTKVFAALLMLLGRLEILAPLVLMTRTFWRR
jgi:trk system potassium uptake protein TrkH